MPAHAASAPSISFPARIDCAEDASGWLSARASLLAIDDQLRFNIELCLEEVVLNLITHGRATLAEVSLTREDGRIRLTVSDDGVPFDPTRAPGRRAGAPLSEAAIGGLGIGLIQGFAQAMTYERVDGMNRLTLEFGSPA